MRNVLSQLLARRRESVADDAPDAKPYRAASQGVASNSVEGGDVRKGARVAELKKRFHVERNPKDDTQCFTLDELLGEFYDMPEQRVDNAQTVK